MHARYVIRSTTDSALYWSNADGWTPTCPTVFSGDDRAAFNLPMGGTWLPLADLPAGIPPALAESPDCDDLRIFYLSLTGGIYALDESWIPGGVPIALSHHHDFRDYLDAMERWQGWQDFLAGRPEGKALRSRPVSAVNDSNPGLLAVVRAFALGFAEHVRRSDLGRTWGDSARNEAYDRGWNLADRLTGRRAS